MNECLFLIDWNTTDNSAVDCVESVQQNKNENDKFCTKVENDIVDLSCCLNIKEYLNCVYHGWKDCTKTFNGNCSMINT